MTNRTLVVALLGLAVLACRPDMQAWERQMEAPTVRRLAGEWVAKFALDRSPGDTSKGRAVDGSMQLTLNHERLTVSGWGKPPVAFGTYDIPFDRLGVGDGASSGVPAIAVGVVRDSVILQLDPGSSLPILLRGLFQHDSVVGRWSAYQRAGPGGIGSFVLHRLH
jgi:hypothetical protein